MTNRIGTVSALLLLLVATCTTSGVRAEPAPNAVVSLLALGDTGKPPGLLPLADPFRAVAAAMMLEDQRRPVDGLVLLGDNFYPDGLKERKAKDRLRANVVGPLCYFVRLTQRGRGSLADSCSVPEAERNPVPLHVVLGNHDYNERESPMLQRRRVPQYIENWSMPEGALEVRELPGGVSLILLESMRWVRRGGGEDLADAVRRSRGPWRIVAAHHPMVDTGESRNPRYTSRIARVMQTAGVPIHLSLAGHEHNLQAIVHPGASPPLHAIAGSGSDLRKVSDGDPGRRFASEVHGFVRVDVESEPEPRMLVTFFAVGALRVLPATAGTPIARFEVTLDRRVDGPIDEISAAAVSVPNPCNSR